MHILMISDNETRGGAAIAASNLAESLINEGVKVSRVVYFKNVSDSSWDTISISLNASQYFFLNQVSKVSNNLRQLFFNVITQGKLKRAIEKLKPDIINVHNLHYASWDPELVNICCKYAPTVWTLHDMWSFTGRCVYNYSCRNFETYCDHNCPTPTEYPSLKPHKIYGSWREKKEIIKRNENLSAVSPSKWLESEAKKGVWSDRFTTSISNGLDTNIYKPTDKYVAKKKLNIDCNRPTIAVGAHNINDKKKGYDFLIGCLELIKIPINLIKFGSGDLSITNNNIKIINYEYIEKESEKALIYNASDIFLHTAPLDNFPNTILESISCGTPCVAFNVGGIPEMVIPNVTGWLSNKLDIEELYNALNKALIEIENGKDLLKPCREFALQKFDSKIQAKNYINLFTSLLN